MGGGSPGWGLRPPLSTLHQRPASSPANRHNPTMSDRVLVRTNRTVEVLEMATATADEPRQMSAKEVAAAFKISDLAAASLNSFTFFRVPDAPVWWRHVPYGECRGSCSGTT